MADPQRARALHHANNSRLGRVEFKARIHAGDIQIADVLADLPACLSSMPVYRLLLIVPKIGRVRASRVLRRADVWPLKPVGELTARQCGRLVRELENAWAN